MYTKECPRLLVMVFGAPGSGKSAFADHLERTIKNEQQGQNVAVLSTDCIQEFIQRHGASPPLREACTPQFRCSYRLRRNEFSDKAWKISREYVKTGICNLLEGIPLVIVEDDLLLNSQRKPFRRVAAQKQCQYVECLMNCSIQECLAGNALRMEGERLKEEVVRSSHAKLEMGNCAVVIGRDDWGTIDLKWLMSHCRWILAHEQKDEHACEGMNHSISSEQQRNNEVQIQIRREIGKRIKESQKYFPGMSKKQAAEELAEQKKKYYEQKGIGEKSFQGFLTYSEHRY